MSRRSFPLNAVETFIVTARHLNLTHAARELCLTQGAVSRKIASLESWFGFPLFDVRRLAISLHISIKHLVFIVTGHNKQITIMMNNAFLHNST